MNIRKFAAVAAACVGMSLAAGAASAQSFTNGSFETGNLTGWTSDSNFGVNPFGTTYGQGMDGTYWHWLAGFERPVTTSQTITGLSTGTTYAVSFIMASEYNLQDSLRVSVNGGPGTLFSAGPYNPGGFNGGFWTNWESKQFNFTAAGTSATIQFDTVGLNTGGYDVGLDNVSISALSVPEPATWAMLIIGFGGSGMILRRRRDQLARVAA